MKLFGIRYGEQGHLHLISLMYYYSKSDSCVAELAPGRTLSEVPDFFSDFARRGAVLNPQESLLFLEKCSSEEKCSVEPLAGEPAWMEDRKKRWLSDAVLLPGARIFLSFQDGRCGIASLQAFFSLNQDSPSVLRPEEEQAEVKLIGGRVLFFGGGRFLMSEDLYAGPLTGITSAADLFCIEQARYVDVPDLCRETGVSRQYINRRLTEKGIRPFRKCGGNNLYLRSEVLPLLDY